MKSKILHIGLILGWLSFALKAQDVHFSQYYLSPLSLNAANTGNYKGDYRFFGNYRSQWRELNNAYNTVSAGGDFNFYTGNINLSGGLAVISDKSAINLSVTKILPSAAWHFKLGGFKMHLGVQPGIVLKTINFNANTFPSQLNWNTGSFDKTLPNGESGYNQQFWFFDLNSGIHITRRFGNVEPEIGYALFHINEPRESFFKARGGKNFLKIRQAYNLGINYYIKHSVILHAYSLYGYTTKVSDWTSGLNIEFVLFENSFYKNSVYFGSMWRSGIQRNYDAGVATVGFNYKSYTVGFSYDVTFSQLKTSVDSKGAFEVAIIYRAKSTHLNSKTVPCDRY